jgi:hypothetical protein
MNQLIYILVAAAVLVFLGGTVIFLGTNSTGSISDFVGGTDDQECRTQADLWEEGDSIDEECIDELPEEDQEAAMVETVTPDIT